VRGELEATPGLGLSLHLHHVGILVAAIEPAQAAYVRTFGHVTCTDVVHDPVQTAYVQFLKLPHDAVYVELVSPDGEGSKLANALRKGGGLNHLCYATPDIDAACRQLRASGLFALQAPVPAVAFRGRRIAWFMGADRVAFEVVERGPPGEL